MVKYSKQIYPDIKYAGVTDDYLYHFTQPRHKHLPAIRMYTGDKHYHTLSQQTLELLQKQQSLTLEDKVGEVYQDG